MSLDSPDKSYLILVLNPGSTSTKISVYENERERFTATVRHPAQEMARFQSIPEQLGFRLETVKKALAADWAGAAFDAAVGRGGLVQPIASGTYAVNDLMLADLRGPGAARHASSLGAVLAHEFGREWGRPAFIVDPVVVDELEPVARVTGLPHVARSSILHALNQKAVARQCAADLGLKYEQARLVVAHLGGGISIGAHRGGRIIDVNNALTGEGPFSPERCGGLAVAEVINLCFSGRYTQAELLSFTNKNGGLTAHLQTNDLRECENRIERGDRQAAVVVEALAYQVSKEIGAMAAVLSGRVDAIALTGGLAYSAGLVARIEGRVKALAPVRLYPGEKEMEALALGALRVLRGEEEAKVYAPC